MFLLLRRICSFIFWENSKTPKSSFEIIWPLKHLSLVITLKPPYVMLAQNCILTKVINTKYYKHLEEWLCKFSLSKYAIGFCPCKLQGWVAQELHLLCQNINLLFIIFTWYLSLLSCVERRFQAATFHISIQIGLNISQSLQFRRLRPLSISWAKN